jgi:hypothetical protein
MAARNPGAKPVTRQVLDHESPSVTSIEQAVAPADSVDGTAATASPEQPRARRERTGGRPRRRRDVLEEPITRGYVAWCLSVDVSTVRRLEARGQLHPRIGSGGIRYFDMREVRRVRAERLRQVVDRTADMRLAAFALFRRGVDWRDVAIKLRYDPYRVHRLWRLYSMDEALRRVRTQPRPETHGPE